MVVFYEILPDFGLRVSILATFSLWGEIGSKSKKKSINRFRGGWDNIF